MDNNQIIKDQPTPTAKIILYTSQGELQLQLWAKQTPLTCRNFIQLCMQGYYNNTIFHRMIPSFMIQGGDPTGTGFGGQSIYGSQFKDQFHQRLKFNRRGILAMANSGKNTNKSQFFITFAQCQHLNKKHTIFGKIVGDTIYNLLAMQSLDTDANDRPTYPPIIKKIKIVVNPFQDIQPRKKVIQQILNNKQIQQQQIQKSKINIQQKRKKKQQLKKLKQKNKLSFNQQQQQNNQIYKIKSSHDVLTDSKLSKKLEITIQDIQKKKIEKQIQGQKIQQLHMKIQNAKQNGQNISQNINDILNQQLIKKKKLLQNNLENKVEDQILNYKKIVNPQTKRVQFSWGQQPVEEEDQQQQSQQILDQKMKQVRQMQIKQYQALKADQLNFKKIKQGSLKERRKQLINQQKSLLSNVEKRRYQYLQKNKQVKVQQQLFTKLNKFTQKLFKNDTNNWMNHQLKFHIDSQNAYKISGQKKQEEDDGGLQVQDDWDQGNKREGIDIDQLYQLTKKQNQ